MKLNKIGKKGSKKDCCHLIPKPNVILSEEWCKLIEYAPKMAESPIMKVYHIATIFLSFGIYKELTVSKIILNIIILIACLLALKYIFDVDKIFNVFTIDHLIIIVIILFMINSALWWFYREPKHYLDNLISKKEEFLFEKLEKRSGREVLERLKNWSKKMK